MLLDIWGVTTMQSCGGPITWVALRSYYMHLYAVLMCFKVLYWRVCNGFRTRPSELARASGSSNAPGSSTSSMAPGSAASLPELWELLPELPPELPEVLGLAVAGMMPVAASSPSCARCLPVCTNSMGIWCWRKITCAQALQRKSWFSMCLQCTIQSSMYHNFSTCTILLDLCTSRDQHWKHRENGSMHDGYFLFFDMRQMVSNGATLLHCIN